MGCFRQFYAILKFAFSRGVSAGSISRRWSRLRRQEMGPQTALRSRGTPRGRRGLAAGCVTPDAHEGIWVSIFWG